MIFFGVYVFSYILLNCLLVKVFFPLEDISILLIRNLFFPVLRNKMSLLGSERAVFRNDQN